MFITRKVWPNPGKIISQMAKLQNSDSDALRKAQGMFSHIWNVSKCEIHYQYRTQNEKINQTPKKNKKKNKKSWLHFNSTLIRQQPGWRATTVYTFN